MNTDDLFKYIIEYKKTNDGISPTRQKMQAAFGVGAMKVQEAVKELEAAGKITLTDNGKIKVVGGHWIYTPDFTTAQRNGAEAEAVVTILEHINQ